MAGSPGNRPHGAWKAAGWQGGRQALTGRIISASSLMIHNSKARLMVWLPIVQR